MTGRWICFYVLSLKSHFLNPPHPSFTFGSRFVWIRKVLISELFEKPSSIWGSGFHCFFYYFFCYLTPQYKNMLIKMMMHWIHLLRVIFLFWYVSFSPVWGGQETFKRRLPTSHPATLYASSLAFKQLQWRSKGEKRFPPNISAQLCKF